MVSFGTTATVAGTPGQAAQPTGEDAWRVNARDGVAFRVAMDAYPASAGFQALSTEETRAFSDMLDGWILVARTSTTPSTAVSRPNGIGVPDLDRAGSTEIGSPPLLHQALAETGIPHSA